MSNNNTCNAISRVTLPTRKIKYLPRRGKSGDQTAPAKVTQATGNIAGWSSLVARRAHNPKVVGSNPAPATN